MGDAVVHPVLPAGLRKNALKGFKRSNPRMLSRTLERRHRLGHFSPELRLYACGGEQVAGIPAAAELLHGTAAAVAEFGVSGHGFHISGKSKRSSVFIL